MRLFDSCDCCWLLVSICVCVSNGTSFIYLLIYIYVYIIFYTLISKYYKKVKLDDIKLDAYVCVYFVFVFPLKIVSCFLAYNSLWFCFFFFTFIIKLLLVIFAIICKFFCVYALIFCFLSWRFCFENTILCWYIIYCYDRVHSTWNLDLSEIGNS